MIKLYYTYRIYKKFLNPVLGRRKLNQAGFFNLYGFESLEFRPCLISYGDLGSIPNVSTNSGTKMYGFGGSFPSRWQVKTVSPFHLIALLDSFDLQFILQLGLRTLFSFIKGRVERDCLNSKQSILSVLLARFGLIEYNVARMGNKQSYTLLRKLNRGLYHTS